MAHVSNSPSAELRRRPRKRANPGVRHLGTRPQGDAARPGAHIRRARRTPPSLPRTPRQRRANETVEAILSAAARILVERGYAAASTNAIAKRAGVSIGSLYQYFRDKNAVFAAVVERHRHEVKPVVARILERMQGPDADMVELTMELLRRMAEVNSKDPHLLAAIDRELGWLERGQAEEEHAQEAVAAILRRRHVKHAYPVEVTATLLVTIITPLSRWMVHSKPEWLDSEPFVQAFGQMLRGLLGER